MDGLGEWMWGLDMWCGMGVGVRLMYLVSKVVDWKEEWMDGWMCWVGE